MGVFVAAMYRVLPVTKKKIGPGGEDLTVIGEEEHFTEVEVEKGLQEENSKEVDGVKLEPEPEPEG